jgi:hypothetical protein
MFKNFQNNLNLLFSHPEFLNASAQEKEKILNPSFDENEYNKKLRKDVYLFLYNFILLLKFLNFLSKKKKIFYQKYNIRID